MLLKKVLEEDIKLNNNIKIKKGTPLYIKPKQNTLYEMPYVSTYPNKLFDLELENIKSFNELYNFLENILSGRMFKDKYKNEIKLDNNRIKSLFVRDLLDNKIFNTILLSKFKNDEVDKLYSLLDMYM